MEPIKKTLRKLPPWLLALLVTVLGALVVQMQQVLEEPPATQPASSQTAP